MPYISLTHVSNPSQPRTILVNTAHIQVIGTRKVARHGDDKVCTTTYIEIAGRASNIDVAESPVEILRAIDVAEAGHA